MTSYDIEYADYLHSGNPSALIAKLVEDREDLRASPVVITDTGVHLFRDGAVIDPRSYGERPSRRSGNTAIDTPSSFVDYVSRLAVDETVIYAQRRDGTFVAVFDDHPAVGDHGESAEMADAGWRGHTATLRLQTHEDWTAWVSGNGSLRPQREFGEFIDAMAHTIVEPDSATMLEVATTLTMKRSLDFDSRVRLTNGDVEFKFQEESNMRAGRATSVEIPSTFTFAAPVWVGTDPVEVHARLRVRASGEGVVMGYKLLRVADAEQRAFDDVVAGISVGADPVPVFHGSPSGR